MSDRSLSPAHRWPRSLPMTLAAALMYLVVRRLRSRRAKNEPPGQPQSDAGAPTAKNPYRERLDDAAKWLAGGFATVTAVLGGVGATGGALERMIRNHPLGAVLAFLAIVAAIGLAVVSLSSFFGESDRVSRWLVLISSVLFAFGLALAVYIAVATPSLKERPRVTASLTPSDAAWKLDATVRAAGLRATDSFIIVADALRPEEQPERLYKAQVGPDPAGIVDHSFSLQVTSDAPQVAVTGSLDVEQRTKCLDGNLAEGCVILSVPPPPPKDSESGS